MYHFTFLWMSEQNLTSLFKHNSRWRRGATGRASNLPSRGRRFHSHSGRGCTIGKLFTPLWPYHQTVCTGQWDVIPWGREGNRKSLIALAMRHRRQWSNHPWAEGLRKGDEYPYVPTDMEPFSSTFTYSMLFEKRVFWVTALALTHSNQKTKCTSTTNTEKERKLKFALFLKPLFHVKIKIFKKNFF